MCRWISMLLAASFLMLNSPIYAQNPTDVPTAAQLVQRDGERFSRAIIEQATKMVHAGKLRRADLIKLRVAMLSPAFRKHAEDLAVIQMASSESDAVPMSADGSVDRGSINWEGLAAFLEVFIPLLLELIKALSQIDPDMAHWMLAGTMDELVAMLSMAA